MTLTRLREIVAAMRSEDGCACSPSEMSDAFLLLATLAGIGSEDVDLDGFVARALAAHGDAPEPWEATPEIVVWSAPGVDDEPGWEVGPDILAADGTMTASVAAHIAGAHPQAVLALVALVRRERAIAAAERALREALVMDGPRDEACGCENCADYGAAEDALRALGVEP